MKDTIQQKLSICPSCVAKDLTESFALPRLRQPLADVMFVIFVSSGNPNMNWMKRLMKSGRDMSMC
jgi:hypothetical protein